ncbi:hypothetical protein Mal4_12290 [Maioricimonas rarisocia]|uniref:Uncharacterized protein n=1 Tax=Maioricimonas rarisocia TaxID=2528026 RepID=A0A517Z398_9PLAN|nr:hypothetical protein [Maioricimonas rarisocia]QDU36928.1 hypothetical protein Mal4_12290 [Maioricimonas rarisocia]
MNSISIETAAGQTHFAPGAEIDVYLDWQLDEDPAALEVRVVWHTAGKGDMDLGVAHTVRLDHPTASGNRQMTITLPRAPYSFSGRLVSLMWGLECVALPDGTSARKEIMIAPQGDEVRLPQTSS